MSTSIEEEYREIELYLQKAQEEIGQALDNLRIKDKNSGADENANTTGTAGDVEVTVSAPRCSSSEHCDSQDNHTGATNATGGQNKVDFLAIFAQNNLLVEDYTALTSGDRTWNYTLPIVKKRPERPKTLAPPTTLPSCGRFKKQDWRVLIKYGNGLSKSDFGGYKTRIGYNRSLSTGGLESSNSIQRPGSENLHQEKFLPLQKITANGSNLNSNTSEPISESLSSSSTGNSGGEKSSDFSSLGSTGDSSAKDTDQSVTDTEVTCSHLGQDVTNGNLNRKAAEACKVLNVEASKTLGNLDHVLNGKLCKTKSDLVVSESNVQPTETLIQSAPVLPVTVCEKKDAKSPKNDTGVPRSRHDRKPGPITIPPPPLEKHETRLKNRSLERRKSKSRERSASPVRRKSRSLSREKRQDYDGSLDNESSLKIYYRNSQTQTDVKQNLKLETKERSASLHNTESQSCVQNCVQPSTEASHLISQNPDSKLKKDKKDDQGKPDCSKDRTPGDGVEDDGNEEKLVSRDGNARMSVKRTHVPRCGRRDLPLPPPPPPPVVPNMPPQATNNITVKVEVHVSQSEKDKSRNARARPVVPKDRRVCARPQMPAIAEDGTRSDDASENEADNLSCSGSWDSRRHQRTPSSSSSGTFSDGQRSPDFSLQSQGSTISGGSTSSHPKAHPPSLLDAMHKKYYPDQYKRQNKAKSAEILYKPKRETSDTHPDSGTYPGAGHKTTPDRLSDSGIHSETSSSAHNSCLSSPRSVHSGTCTSPFMSPAAEVKIVGQRLSSPAQLCPEEGATSMEDEEQTGEEQGSQFKSEREQAEIEALEACKWLRAAGFPQYAQMYEDLQFPIDIASVEKDHDFLDRDSIQSLFRRLNILNKCAAMKIDAPPRKSVDESDEEDQCALSDKWKFQRSCRRWSRKDLEQLQLDDGADKPGIRSSSSHDSVLTDNESLSQHGDSPLLNKKTSQEKPDLRSAKSPLSSRRSAKLPSNSPQMLLCSDTSDTEQRLGGSRSPVSPRLKRAASERLNRAKNFLKRMESLKTRKSKKVTKSSGDKVEISGPLVMNSQDMQDRMNRLGCVDISPSEENPPSGSSVVTRRQKRSDLNAPTEQNSDSDTSPSLAKRGGMVFMDSSFNPSAYSNVNETTKDEVTSNETSQKLNVPLGHKRTLSSSDAHDYAEVFEDQRSDSLPKIVSNGYIDVGNGSQINYRTGSFNLGSESDAFRENLRRTRGGLQDPNKLDSDKGECSENRLSVYDNVPTTGSDPQHELDLILHDLFQNINGLNQSLQSEVAPENSVEYQVNMVLDSSVPSSVAQAPNSPMSLSQEDGPVTDHKKAINTSGNLEQDNDHASGTSSNQEMSDADTPGSREDEGSDPPETRERRDSGVGSSLTRAPSDRRRPRIRWHSFVKSHRPSLNSRSLQINNMSAGQLMVLRKLSLLKVTALMEKYSPSNRSGWNWVVPKFIKRFKSPDYKDKNVFAVPLGIIFQRTGQPLPQCILYAMRCLRRTAQDAVGIFRKSGVRSRIQKLRNQIEANPDSVDFESLQAYDVADLLKQYFRELPECLLTNKLSETFISIYTHVPAEMRLEALQAAIMLMPDENRQVLQSLLLFLSDMAQHADRNQMNASNLAVCFAPSLFHLSGPRTNHAASPKRSRKNLGIPDQKELLEQKAAHECLTHMIVDCKKLFMIPEDMLSKCRFSYIEQGDPVSLDELSKKRTEDGTANYTAHIESCIQGLLKESRDKFKGWVSISSPNSTDLAYKKVGDGHPLRLWKSSVEVEAPPVEVLNRVLRERHVWDEDMLKWRTIERLDRETEVFQWVSNSMAPHPTRDFTELRSWRTALPKGACVLVSTSVEHADATPLGGVRGVVLASRYLIEPCGSGKSRLTHICRVDVRGHTVEWYNKSYGYLCANYMARIRDSFKQSMATTDGPETKV